MTNINDFVIEDAVLKEYKGQGEDVVIPNSVTGIGDRTIKRRRKAR